MGESGLSRSVEKLRRLTSDFIVKTAR